MGMAKKIITTNEKIGLGFFSLPILEFNERFEEIQKNNPQLTTDEAAAVVYFGMLADTPMPTKQGEVWAVFWGDSIPPEKWLESEYNQRYYAIYSGIHPPFRKVDAQTGYLNNVNVLQNWLIYNGLWNGIEKTLSEESRKLQAQAAAVAASEQAAARALAMSRITEDMSEEARIEAATKQEQANNRLQELLKQEEALKKRLQDIENGIITPEEGLTDGKGSFGLLAAIGTAAALLFLGG